MKRANVFAVLIVALLATVGTLTAQEKYAVIIGGKMNPGSSIPAAEQWNGGQSPGAYGFDEIWNDLYLAWEMLITETKPFGKGYHVDNVNVLFGDYPAQDFTFDQQDGRYQAGENDQPYVVDEDAQKSTIANRFTAMSNTITEDDFLFVWIMGHGGSDATGHYFYSYDNQKIYASELATWLGSISAHRKVIYLSFPKSGGFAPVLENAGNVVITACGATEGASRADDLAPGGPFIENEVRNTITYNHGEMNYHFTSSLTGQTPLEVDQYDGQDLSDADGFIADGFVMMEEMKWWVINHETLLLEDIVYSNPFFINFFTDCSLEYPTLLFSNITTFNQFVARGLVAVSANLFVYNDAHLTFSDGSVVDFTANLPDAWFIDGSYLTIGEGVTLNFQASVYQFASLTDNIDIQSNLTINAPEYNADAFIIFSNPNANISLDILFAYNCNFIFDVNHLETFNSWIQLSMMDITAETSHVDSTFFAGSTLKFAENGLCRVNTCNLFNYFSGDNEETNYTGIYLSDCDDYGINGCMVLNYLSDGIRIYNSGHGNILNIINDNTISGNGSGGTATNAGIRLYNSNATLNQNAITGSEIGVEILNRSQVSIVGNRNAVDVEETQQIHDNSENQVYATDGAFPYEFRFNAIYDDDNDCLVKYIPDPTGISPNLDVRYNFWGTNFDPQTDLCPWELYSWNPVWNLQFQNLPAENDELLFTQAGTFADSGQYVQANATYEQLVNQYPNSDYAVAALKEMYIIENLSTENFTSLKNYYASIANQNPNTQICKTANFFSNLCDIQMKNYSNAISWYESVIQEPPTFEDSLFAIIDLGNLYLKMEEDSLKSAPVGALPEYKPQSQKHYSENRDYLISLLFKGQDATMQSGAELSQEKPAALTPNVPNPFAGSTMVNYELTQETTVEICVYDYTGKIVKTLKEGSKETGKHTTKLHAGDLAPGIYFCAIKCDGILSDTQKIMIIK